jgi:preprotein translocase subunit SecA
MLSKSVERAQKKVEERNFMIRKNVLEYDEVMEYQRDFFYGLRQDILEGQGIKDLIFQYITESVEDKISECLARDYVSTQIGAWAVERLGWAVEIDKLKGKEPDDVIRWLRNEAKAEARQTIDVTLGEYMPYGTDPVDWNLKGLAEWARNRFNVEMKPHLVREMTQDEVMSKLCDAAFAAIDRAELEGVDQFLVKHYGERQVAAWVKRKFDFEVKAEELAELETDEERIDLIVDRAHEKYRLREAQYPVEFVMDMTMAYMRQDPAQAMQNLLDFANQRLQMGWEEKYVRNKMPQQIRAELEEASRRMFSGGGIEEEVQKAQAISGDDKLAEHLRQRYGYEMADDDRGLEGEARDEHIDKLVRDAIRKEVTQFEQYVLIEILDSTWKDHLYAMDQLRETISYRAFSQQDPRIEYKREGARYFENMKQSIRDRVTDIIFKARLQPGAMAQQQQAPPAPRQRQEPQPQPRPEAGQPTPVDGGGLLQGSGTAGGASGIVGAGLEASHATVASDEVVKPEKKPATRRSKNPRPKGKKRK